MTKVSVVVPCYNVEKYVSKCLQTLCNQTLQDIEIICVDDKSTDSTLDILQQYAAQDSRIQVQCNKSNRGVSFSRNIGLQYAHGEYVGFVDPDDYVDFDLQKPVAVIPSAAIHVVSDVNEGAKFDLQTEIRPFVGQPDEGCGEFMRYVADDAGVDEADILSFDMLLYDAAPAEYIGINEEFISSNI